MEMDIWDRIFPEKFHTIFKVFLHISREEAGQPNIERFGQRVWIGGPK